MKNQTVLAFIALCQALSLAQIGKGAFLKKSWVLFTDLIKESPFSLKDGIECSQLLLQAMTEAGCPNKILGIVIMLEFMFLTIWEYFLELFDDALNIALKRDDAKSARFFASKEVAKLFPLLFIKIIVELAKALIGWLTHVLID